MSVWQLQPPANGTGLRERGEGCILGVSLVYPAVWEGKGPPLFSSGGDRPTGGAGCVFLLELGLGDGVHLSRSCPDR